MQECDKPFIHLFNTPLGYYIYDVNTNNVLKIPVEVHHYLEGQEEYNTTETKRYIEELKKNGFLKTNRVKITKHPLGEFLPFYLENGLENLVLQVTQNCNLRCEYCLYSGGYNTRTHTNKRMSFDTMKAAIDFFVQHSKNTRVLSFGFYGGEPLLEMDLIRRGVEYIEKVTEGKRVQYTFTTNGTLLTEELFDYLVAHEFRILVSIDGPCEVHDFHRKFANSEKGSFEIMIKNLQKLQEAYPEYFDENVGVSTVLDPSRSFGCVNDYFISNKIFKNLTFSTSVISDSFSKNAISIEETFAEEYQYDQFKLFLYKLNRFSKEEAESILKDSFQSNILDFDDKFKNSRKHLPEIGHHGGACIPGVKRLFVTVDGEFYPCEKVSESAEKTHIGNLEKGFDLEAIQYLLNLEKLTEEKCHNCWAYSLCSVCARCVEETQENTKKSLEKSCESARINAEEMLKDFTVLKELSRDMAGKEE